MKNFLFIVFIATVVSSTIFAQNTQTIRGTVYDKESKMPVIGASVVLLNSNPAIGSMSDENGNFKLSGVALGRQGIEVNFLGYKSALIDNLLLSKGKEIVLEIEIEENITKIDEVVVKSGTSKDRSNNTMASVSARTFSVEETEKYAGSRGDVARMAMNFAGVSAANDSRNDIVIRGNSPGGLLWRLDDIEIPNPNHFAENGTTGGPVGMLNNNLMQNSDFMTSAFPAEYGNALSGVFDLKLRNGNNEKHEFLGQSGFNGFEFGAEGPINRQKGSSYLVNGRYSTLELLDQMGVNFGTVGVPKYKDFCIKINIPVEKGRISFFSMGGTSEIAMVKSKLTEEQLNKSKDLYSGDSTDLYNHSEMLVSGLSYTRFINERSHFKLSLSGLYTNGGTNIDTFSSNKIPYQNIHHNYAEYRTSINAFFNTKYSNRLSTKTGLIVDIMGYNLFTEKFIVSENQWRNSFDDQRKLFKGMNLYRAYYQATYKLSDQLSINPGLHTSFFELNSKYTLEPRIGMSWQANDKNRFSAGYGLHSKIQSLYTYFYRYNTTEFTNKDLDPTFSHQFVMGHDIKLGEYIRLKTELYYQSLFNVPVETRATNFTMLNSGATFGFSVEDSLANEGVGRNYGIEITLEQFLHNGFYWLSTVSIFDSKAAGSDNIMRNTAFNSHYVVNFLAGKEFRINENGTFTTDLKLTIAGGRPYTPLDETNTVLNRRLTYDESKPYSLFFEPFIRPDIKFGYKLNSSKRNFSQEWIFYIENFINHQNPFMMSYNFKENKLQPTYQLGFFPMMQYRITF